MPPFALIESNFRVDISNRAIQGASWGGLLVRHALSREMNNPLFKHFISMDGSYFHDNGKYQEMEDTAFPQGAILNANLYLSGAKKIGNNAVVKTFSEQLTNRDITGLNIFFESFNVMHEQVSRPSIKDALIKLYP